VICCSADCAEEKSVKRRASFPRGDRTARDVKKGGLWERGGGSLGESSPLGSGRNAQGTLHIIAFGGVL